ncbi:signal recognition particle protein [Candidatus Lariskella endosymbiont of Epinotia ramella]|uniref:signal recognition particle protein n=1 Tax=Candidatus Lariskella endosymbiont of Epinotia ramella TaxID=3066224 RepID=UPI0030D20629
MFSSLGDSLTKIFDRLKGNLVLSESNIAEAIRAIRIALLESDVALLVVKGVIEKIQQKAIGQKVLDSVSPAQMFVKIVHDELIAIISSEDNRLDFSSKGDPVGFLMVGLQGAGKTTTTAKLALRLRQKYKKSVLLVSLDTSRPAAQKQLELLAKQLSISSLPIIQGQGPMEIAKRAQSVAREMNADIILFDTAGRMHTDDALMNELISLQKFIEPKEVLLVVDSMLGQDAAKIAKTFVEQIALTGIILTKADGDAKGGAALSMRVITGMPIKFMGVGEKPGDLEEFDPERTISRILGMGDIVALVEKASENISEKEAEKIASRFQKGLFDMNDLAAQLKTLRKMGGLGSLLGMIPGLGKIKQSMQNAKIDERVLLHQQAIIQSMTPWERKNPKMINASRKQRISKGSGTSVQEINKLIKQCIEMQGMVKKFSKMDQGQMQKMQNMMNIKFQ